MSELRPLPCRWLRAIVPPVQRRYTQLRHETLDRSDDRHPVFRRLREFDVARDHGLENS